MHSHLKATLSDKVDFVLGLFAIGAERPLASVAVFSASNIRFLVIPIAYAALRHPFMSDSESQPTLGHEIHHSVIRWGLDRFNVTQLQWAFPSSSQAYKTWVATRAKAEEAPSEVFTEFVGEEGAKLHWVGHKDAKKVVLHFHGYSQLPAALYSINIPNTGGGYVLPLFHAHLNLINHFRREIKRRSGMEVKVALLEYS